MRYGHQTARAAALLRICPAMNAADIYAADVRYDPVAAAQLDDRGRRFHVQSLRDSQVSRQRSLASLATDFLCGIRNDVGMSNDIKDVPGLALRLAELRGRGATQAGLAKHLRRNPSAISRMLKDQRDLRAREIPKINEYLQQFDPVSGEDRGPMNAHVFPNIGDFIPVRATVAGNSPGSFVISEEIVNRIERPATLSGARGLYAVYIVGSSMEPEHRAGDLRLVNPHRPPAIGDSVLVQARSRDSGPVQAFIGHLVVSNDKEIALKKLQANTPISFPMKFVSAIHKVMTTAEIFGL